MTDISTESSDSLSRKFKNPGKQFDWSIDRVAECVM